MATNSANPDGEIASKATEAVAAVEASTSLTRREWLSTLGLGLVIAGSAAAIALYAGKPNPAVAPDRPRKLGAFNLVERSGRPIAPAELAGKFLVVNFVFTSCSLKCRGVNDRMAEIQHLVAAAPDVRLVSLTVDPRSDTPAVLARFAASFNADPDRWLFLTGDQTEMYRLIETSFISKSPELEQIVPGGFAGTDRIMLVEPHGNVCASFNGLETNVASAVMKEIANRRKSPVAN